MEYFNWYAMVFFSLPVILILPGYSIISISFPGKGTPTEGAVDFSFLEDTRRPPSPAERILLSVLFSLTISSVIIFSSIVYNVVTAEDIFPLMALVNILLGLLAFIRVTSLPDGDQFHFVLDIETPKWESIGFTGIVQTVLISSILVFSLTFLPDALQSKGEESFTELYLLGPSGTPEDYTIQTSPGGINSVIFVVVNQEGSNQQYEISITHSFYANQASENDPTPSSSEVVYSTMFSLNDGELFQKEHPFSLQEEGYWKLDFELSLIEPARDAILYRQTHLWIQVTE